MTPGLSLLNPFYSHIYVQMFYSLIRIQCDKHGEVLRVKFVEKKQTNTVKMLHDDMTEVVFGKRLSMCFWFPLFNTHIQQCSVLSVLVRMRIRFLLDIA